jgi:hypothetical protein
MVSWGEFFTNWLFEIANECAKGFVASGNVHNDTSGDLERQNDDAIRSNWSVTPYVFVVFLILVIAKFAVMYIRFHGKTDMTQKTPSRGPTSIETSDDILNCGIGSLFIFVIGADYTYKYGFCTTVLNNVHKHGKWNMICAVIGFLFVSCLHDRFLNKKLLHAFASTTKHFRKPRINTLESKISSDLNDRRRELLVTVIKSGLANMLSMLIFTSNMPPGIETNNQKHFDIGLRVAYPIIFVLVMLNGHFVYTWLNPVTIGRVWIQNGRPIGMECFKLLKTKLM